MKTTKSTKEKKEKERKMKVLPERREMRQDKLEEDFKILQSEIIDPLMVDVLRNAESKGCQTKVQPTLFESGTCYTIIYDNPYREVNIEIDINDTLSGIHMWVDMEDEYSEWTEVTQQKISKRITREQLSKEVATAINKSRSLIKAKK